jgi:23S rRNA (guanosine2251-2'-O)-methyltransferase
MNHHSNNMKNYGNLTIYGRNPVLEALRDSEVDVLRLHLARSNKDSAIIGQLRSLAQQRDIPVIHHSKLELSRISRNSRQDQGVAADLLCPGLQDVSSLQQQVAVQRLIALDGINNPQNLGMVIRSVGASTCDGLLLSREKGNTRLSPLVVKASAGAFFKTPIYTCDDLGASLGQLQDLGFSIVTLSADAPQSLLDMTLPQRCVFVLGNESDGISAEVARLADLNVAIPLQRGIESLNVAVSAALVAFVAGHRHTTGTSA